MAGYKRICRKPRIWAVSKEKLLWMSALLNNNTRQRLLFLTIKSDRCFLKYRLDEKVQSAFVTINMCQGGKSVFEMKMELLLWKNNAAFLPLPENDDAQAGRIRGLKRERLLPPNIDDILYVLRKRRNGAMHADLDSHYNFIVVPGTNVRNRWLGEDLSAVKVFYILSLRNK